MPRQNGEGDFLTKDGERRFGENLRKVLLSDNPNPRRKGCPDPKTIRDLAFHRKIGTPEVFERATAHMWECSRACETRWDTPRSKGAKKKVGPEHEIQPVSPA